MHGDEGRAPIFQRPQRPNPLSRECRKTSGHKKLSCPAPASSPVARNNHHSSSAQGRSCRTSRRHRAHRPARVPDHSPARPSQISVGLWWVCLCASLAGPSAIELRRPHSNRAIASGFPNQPFVFRDRKNDRSFRRHNRRRRGRGRPRPHPPICRRTPPASWRDPTCTARTTHE